MQRGGQFMFDCVSGLSSADGISGCILAEDTGQMKIWGTSAVKQWELRKMLDEWAVCIRRKCGNKPLSSSTYLNEAEPFLEQYAKRSVENRALVGAAGNLVSSENFSALIEGDRDDEGDLHREAEVASPTPSILDKVPKHEGLIVFFPGIPGCAKSALCKEIFSAPGGLGDNRPIHSIMGDLIKERNSNTVKIRDDHGRWHV